MTRFALNSIDISQKISPVHKKRKHNDLSPASWARRWTLDPLITCDRLSYTPEPLVVCLWLGNAGTRQGARVSAWDGNSVVCLLAWGGGYVLNHSLLWSSWCIKAVLRNLWCSAVNFDRWCLKSEWFGSKARRWLGLNKSSARCPDKSIFSLSRRVGGVDGWWEAGRFDVLGVRGRHWSKAWSVGCGLRAQLSQVEIRTSPVTNIHGLPETLLGVVSVEDNAVKQDRDALKNDFDEAAN